MSKWSGIVAMAAACGVFAPSVANACGGCFGPSMTQQVVTDHRMVMAIHSTESILWDQIRYSGNPADFSWVLPVVGNVDINVASGTFFDILDQSTAVNVRAPFVNLTCPGTVFAPSAGGVDDSNSADAGTAVTVLHQQVVGPYQTVTLRSTDANALTDWLRTNNYTVPAAIEPVIAAYVAMHADFLALKLAPGEGIQAMQPVRVTYHGAATVLPLRMVAAGIADKVGITLWVVGNGRYEAANFGNATINANDLVWDWTTNTSNYRDVFARTQNAVQSGRAWVTETAFDAANVRYQFEYGGVMNGVPSADDPRPDWALASQNDAAGTWVTRMRSDLLARFLDADLALRASTSTDTVPNQLQVADGHETGARPVPNCPDSGVVAGDGGSATGSGDAGDAPVAHNGCSTSPRAPATRPAGTTVLALGALATLIASHRARHARR